jgi:hypothetical protein
VSLNGETSRIPPPKLLQKCTWGYRKHESEINVDQMTFLVKHDISIMPIFDLQQKHDDRIGS